MRDTIGSAVYICDETPESLECPVCLSLWKLPLEVKPCRHIICHDCIRFCLWNQKSEIKSCPVCRLQLMGLREPHRLLIAMLSETPVRCSACNWKGKQACFSAHAMKAHGQSERKVSPILINGIKQSIEGPTHSPKAADLSVANELFCEKHLDRMNDSGDRVQLGTGLYNNRYYCGQQYKLACTGQRRCGPNGGTQCPSCARFQRKTLFCWANEKCIRSQCPRVVSFGPGPYCCANCAAGLRLHSDSCCLTADRSSPERLRVALLQGDHQSLVKQNTARLVKQENGSVLRTLTLQIPAQTTNLTSPEHGIPISVMGSPVRLPHSGSSFHTWSLTDRCHYKSSPQLTSFRRHLPTLEQPVGMPRIIRCTSSSYSQKVPQELSVPPVFILKSLASPVGQSLALLFATESEDTDFEWDATKSPVD